MDLKQIGECFGLEITKTGICGKGLINTTYFVEAGNQKYYVLQKINTTVFKQPEDVMENIKMVTEYLSKRGIQTLEFLQTNDGNNFYRVDDEYWRCSKFIENAKAFGDAELANLSDDEKQKVIEAAGKGFGQFAKELRDFNASSLKETIPDFHNTEKRYETFLDAVKNTNLKWDENEDEDAMWIIKYLIDNVWLAKELNDLPLRVTHNDTKTNNVMIGMDEEENFVPVCVIDLDTVMPGSILHDFGDAIRAGTNTGKEDACGDELDNVGVDIQRFESFTKGYLSEVGDVLTDEEKEKLPIAPAVLTYELALRFMTDYLNGNIYFGGDYETRPKLNLERTIAQIKLLESLIHNEEDMYLIVTNVLKGNASKTNPENSSTEM